MSRNTYAGGNLFHQMQRDAGLPDDVAPKSAMARIVGGLLVLSLFAAAALAIFIFGFPAS